MRDEDKPFICYKQGWNIKITPRNGEGWRALAFWMLALLTPTFAFIPFAAHYDDTPQEYIVLWAVVPMLLVTGVITVAMIRWMMARSEIIDVNGLIEIKREQDRRAKRRN
jgi:hypothetical protein